MSGYADRQVNITVKVINQATREMENIQRQMKALAAPITNLKGAFDSLSKAQLNMALVGATAMTKIGQAVQKMVQSVQNGFNAVKNNFSNVTASQVNMALVTAKVMDNIQKKWEQTVNVVKRKASELARNIWGGGAYAANQGNPGFLNWAQNSFNGLEKFNNYIAKSREKMSEFGETLTKVANPIQSFMNMFTRATFYAAYFLFMRTTQQLVESFIKANGEADALKRQFTAMMGSASDAREMFDYLVKLAIKSPFDLPALAESAKLMLALKLNVKEFLPIISQTAAATADFSNGMGEANERMQRLVRALAIIKGGSHATARQLLRIEALGIGRNDILDEQEGINPAGKFQKVRAFAQDTTGRILANSGELVDKIFLIMQNKFGGMTRALSSSWNVLVSNISDAWFKFAVKLGDYGVFGDILADAQRFFDLISSANSQKGEQFAKNFSEYLSDSWLTIKAMGRELYNLLNNPLVKVVAAFFTLRFVLGEALKVTSVILSVLNLVAGALQGIVAMAGAFGLQGFLVSIAGILTGNIAPIVGTVLIGLTAWAVQAGIVNEKFKEADATMTSWLETWKQQRELALAGEFIPSVRVSQKVHDTELQGLREQIKSKQDKIRLGGDSFIDPDTHKRMTTALSSNEVSQLNSEISSLQAKIDDINKSWAEYEQAMAKVTKVTGKTRQQIESMDDEYAKEQKYIKLLMDKYNELSDKGKAAKGGQTILKMLRHQMFGDGYKEDRAYHDLTEIAKQLPSGEKMQLTLQQQLLNTGDAIQKEWDDLINGKKKKAGGSVEDNTEKVLRGQVEFWRDYTQAFKDGFGEFVQASQAYRDYMSGKATGPNAEAQRRLYDFKSQQETQSFFNPGGQEGTWLNGSFLAKDNPEVDSNMFKDHQLQVQKNARATLETIDSQYRLKQITKEQASEQYKQLMLFLQSIDVTGEFSDVIDNLAHKLEILNENSALKEFKKNFGEVVNGFAQGVADLITSGKSLKESMKSIFKGLINDLIKTIIRSGILALVGTLFGSALGGALAFGAGAAVSFGGSGSVGDFPAIQPNTAAVGMFVPQDMIMKVHKGERILPTSLTHGQIDNQGESVKTIQVQENYYSYSAIDSQSLEQSLRNGNLREATSRVKRHGW